MDPLPILQRFDITPDTTAVVTEADLHALLSQRIAWLLEHETELLFSLLYRMDVDEGQVRRALHPNAAQPPAEGLASLLIERQKARLQTKRDTHVPDIDPDLAW
jgi:hypothetical protein